MSDTSDAHPTVDGARAPEAAQPGETGPPGSRLIRPPGDRYRPRRVDAFLERPRALRALLQGLPGVVTVVAAIAFLHAILSMTTGLIAVAAVGGAMIGAGVRRGAWSGQVHRPSRMPTALAMALAVAAWLGGQVAAWLLSMAILPGSTRSLSERLAATPFLDWLAPQFGFLEILELILLTGFAWYASRPGGMQRPVDGAGPS